MATQTIVKNTTYTLDIPIPIINGDEQPDEINLNTLRGVYINLTNEDGSVTFNKVIDFTQLQEKYSDFGTNPYHTVIKGLHNNTLKCDIIYDNETTPKLVLTYEWKEIPSEDPAAREEQYHNIAITSGNDTTNLKIKIEPYVGATYDNCGIPGLVPYATPSEKNMFLKGDGIWDVPEGVKDTNVTLDDETISETKDVDVYKTIYGTPRIYFGSNIINFDLPQEQSQYTSYNMIISNVSYKSNFYVENTLDNTPLEISMSLSPDDIDAISNIYKRIFGSDITYDDPHNIGFYTNLYAVKTQLQLPFGTNVSDNNSYAPQYFTLADLPQNIGETKTFHFNESRLCVAGSVYTAYVSDRHLDFSTFNINIKNIDGNNFEIELYWDLSKEITKNTKFAKINHNTVLNDNSEKTDSVMISVENTSELKTDTETKLNIKIDVKIIDLSI